MGLRVYLPIVLAPLLLAAHVFNNPDFFSSPMDALEAGVAVVALTFLVGVCVAAACRLMGWRSAQGWSFYAALAAIALFVGALVATWVGLLVALLAFTVIAAFALRRAGLEAGPSAAETFAAVVITTALLVGLVDHAPMPDRQVIVIGFDGADWALIQQFREEGRVPQLDALIRSGARADLKTLQPILSPPIWTTIATGVSPDVHRVKDFWSSSEQVAAKRIWDIADEHGLVSGVFGYLLTWPPDSKKNGFLVPGWDAQGVETFPSSLSFIKELEIMGKGASGISGPAALRLGFFALQHGMSVQTAEELAAFAFARRFGTREDTQLALDSRLLKLRLTADVFCDLLRRQQPPLAIYYNSAVDTVEHLFYKYYAPEGFSDVTPELARAYGVAIPRVYEESDVVARRLIAAGSPNANVIIVSDHGQEPATALGEKWFVIKSVDLLSKLGVSDEVRATNIGPSVLIRSATEKPIGPLAERLTGITTTTGIPVFSVDERSGNEIQLRVHEKVQAVKGVSARIGEADVELSQVLEPSGRISGVHREPAVLILRGPDIAEGVQLEGASVYDIAPTVLALLRLPVARDLEGNVLERAFKVDASALQPVSYVDTFGPKESVSAEGELDGRSLENLRALGYIE